MSTRTVSVELQAKVGQYTSSMDKAAKVTGKTETAVERTSKSTESMSRSMALAGGIAAGAVVLGMRKAIDAASDLNETQSKVAVIFGKSASKIEEFAETSAQALGQSKTQAMNAAATFAVFGKSAGLTGDDLATFSTRFTTLASALASFNNTSPEQAIEAIGAALRGESEPIRAYGVMLDDATLKQEALSLGIINTTKEALTPQQKVLAAQAAIYKQTRDAQGDFARTSDGLANQQRILAAEFQNAQAQLGQFLLPYAKTAVGVFNDLLGKFTSLEPATQKTVVQIVLLGSALAIAGPKLAEMASGLGESARGMTKAKAASIGATAAIAALSAVVIAGTNSIGEMKTALDDSLGDFGKTMNADSLRDAYAQIEELRKKQEDLKTFSGVGDLFSDLGESTGAAIMGWTDINDAMDEYQRKIDDIKGHQLNIFQDVAREMGISVSKARELAKVSGVDLTQGTTKAADAIMDYYDSSVKSKGATEKSADAQGVLNDEYATGEDKVKAFRTQLDLLDGGFVTLDEARDRAKAAIDDFQESLKQNGVTLSSNTAEGRANKDALRNIADTARDSAEEVFKLIEPTKGVEYAQGRANQEMQKGRDAFIKAAEAAGRTKKEAEDLATKYGLIPKSVNTKIKGDTGPARTAVKEFQEWAERQGINIPASLQLSKSDQQLLAGTTPGSPAAARIGGARATGGPLVAGERYTVNERATEWLQLSRDGLSGYIRPGKPVSAGGGVSRSISVAPGAVQVSVAVPGLTKRDAERIADGAIDKLVRELETL